MPSRIIGLVVALSTTVLCSPFPLGAQPPAKIPRIGFMSPAAGPIHVEAAFLEGLREHGWVEGQNIAIEWRFSAGRDDRFPALAVDLLRLNVDLLVTGGNAAILAAQQATKTIPIVMVGGCCAVEAGFAASLARPGGNVTGMTLFGHDLSGKRLELLKQAVPKASRFAVLTISSKVMGQDKLVPYGLSVTEAAARSLGVRLSVHEVEGLADFARAFDAMTRDRAQALLAMGSPLFFVERKDLAALARKHRLPAMGHASEFAEAGGLMAYSESVAETARRAGYYVDRILKGARPGDLPIERPTKFELAVNLGTAKALGITLPQSLLQRVDRAIP